MRLLLASVLTLLVFAGCSPADSSRRASGSGASGAVAQTADAQGNPTRAYFGDTHVHTGWSADAGMDGAITGPEDAFYYARVLEIPTPRWVLYDKIRFAIKDLPREVTLVQQERAVTSPIWYTPGP